MTAALRRAIFPVLVALLAFAIGIALGGGPLQKDEGGDDNAALEKQNAALKDEAASLRSSGTFDDGLNKALSPRLLAGQLAGRTVTLVVLPGVDDDTVQATEQAIKAANGQLAVVAHLSRDFVNPGKKTYVDSVVSASMRGAKDLDELADENTYVRAGALFTRAYAGRGSDTGFDDEAAKIDSELEGARLVKLDDEPLGRGSYVVVLAPGHHGTDSFTTAEMVISHALVYALAKGADAVVVASTPTSSLPGGLIDVVSGDKDLEAARFATINVVNSAAGRTATVYALAAAASSAPGHYGLDGEEVVLPPGLAAQNDN